MLVLAASVRRDGKSLAEIARHELGCPAAVIASVAILFIVIIALAGLGFVVVKALGGEEVKLPAGMEIKSAPTVRRRSGEATMADVTEFPAGCLVRYSADAPSIAPSRERFSVSMPERTVGRSDFGLPPGDYEPLRPARRAAPRSSPAVVVGHVHHRLPPSPSPCSSGLWMYRIRPGRVVEASLIGGCLVLAAVVAGGWIPGSPLERVLLAHARPDHPRPRRLRLHRRRAAGVAAARAARLPHQLPEDRHRDAAGGERHASPTRRCNAPPLNEVFLNGGPTFPGQHLPVRVHLRHVRGDQRVPLARVERHHAEDDRRRSRTSAPSATGRC